MYKVCFSSSFKPAKGSTRRPIQRQCRGARLVLGACRGLQSPRAGVLVGGHHAAKLRVHRRAVEALGKVFRQQFPIRLHVADDALADAQLVESIAAVASGRLERRRIALEAREHEPAPRLHRDLVQREALRVEVRRFHAPRRRDQLAAKVVGPGVVRTNDALAREVTLLLGAQDRPAVPAGVVERLYLQILGAQHDERLGADARHAPVAGRGDLLLARDRDPACVPERVELALVVRRVGIPGGG